MAISVSDSIIQLKQNCYREDGRHWIHSGYTFQPNSSSFLLSTVPSGTSTRIVFPSASNSFDSASKIPAQASAVRPLDLIDFAVIFNIFPVGTLRRYLTSIFAENMKRGFCGSLPIWV